MQQLKTSILNCLKNLKGSGKFASVHTNDFIFPGLQVDNVGEVAFPVNELQAKALIGAAHKAPFGKGSATVLDTNIRSAWEIDADKLTFQNPQWASFLNKAIEKLKIDLGLQDYTIDAHLYKLLIYEEGDFFLPHKDSEKEKGMFGSMVIGLPSKYTGGELVIGFDGEEVVADFAKNESDYKINYVAFYADCNHEVKPLTSGYRVCLVYNLIQKKAGIKIELPSLNSAADKLAQLILENPNNEPNIILLGHQYTPENFSHESLKLNDRYKAEILLKVAQKLGYYAKMCLVTSYLAGAPEYSYYEYGEGADDNAEMDEVYDDSLSIEHWLDSEVPPLNSLAFEEEDLIASFDLNDDEPIIKESTGYMGNYGPDLRHWYHYGAVVIWSPEQNAELLYQQSSATQLEWIAYFNLSKKISNTEAEAINTILLTGLNRGGYSSITPNYNVVSDWIINQNKRIILFKTHKAQLDVLFNNIDTAHWQKLLEWLPGEDSKRIFERLTSELNLSLLEKLLSITRSMASSNKTKDLAEEQTTLLPTYFNQLDQADSIKLSSSALADLFWIETNLPTNGEWIEKISQILISNTDWKYVHSVLVPVLIARKAAAELHFRLLNFCRGYLQQRVNEKPQPPADWSRELPGTSRNRLVWNALKAFMNSPVEYSFEYKKAQAERNEWENAIRNEKVDLKTETIRKGSPHTLLITKTQTAFENQLKIWKEDVALLEKIKS